MSNEIVPMNVQSVLSALEAVDNATPSANQGGQFEYMKCAKGVYTFGVNNQVAAEDSLWVVDGKFYRQGYVAWKDGELIDEHMAGLGEAPIILGELPTVSGDGWQVQKSIALLCIEGGDEGVQAIFKTSSVGGTRGIAELVSAIVVQGRKDPKNTCPVVELTSTSYEHKNKSYGLIHNPVFTVIEFTNSGAEAPKAIEAVEEFEEVEEEVEESVEEVSESVKKRTRRPRK